MLHPADDTYEYGGIVNKAPCNLARIKATSRASREGDADAETSLEDIAPRRVKISSGNFAGDRTGFSEREGILFSEIIRVGLSRERFLDHLAVMY